jgi:hypothetical protein
VASLRFHKGIYSPVAVRRAAEAYAEVARIERRARGRYVEVTITPRPEADVAATLPEEFANYVLYATLLERRG